MPLEDEDDEQPSVSASQLDPLESVSLPSVSLDSLLLLLLPSVSVALDELESGASVVEESHPHDELQHGAAYVMPHESYSGGGS